jgi:hypothetical protein
MEKWKAKAARTICRSTTAARAAFALAEPSSIRGARFARPEFLRNIQIQSLLWSMGGTFIVIIVLGFLEFLGLTQHFNPILIFILFACLMGISSWLLKLRYK